MQTRAEKIAFLKSQQAANDSFNVVPKTREEKIAFLRAKAAPSAEIPGEMESIARGTVQGATGGWADEIVGTGRAVVDDLGEFFSGDDSAPKAKRDEFGRVTNSEELNARGTYKQHRDEYRRGDRAASEANPGLYATSNFVGGVASPLNKIVKGASLMRAGATLGGINAMGTSEAEDFEGMAQDTAAGVGLGAVIGGAGQVAGWAGQKASPYISKKTEKVRAAIQSGKNKVGDKLAEGAETLMLKAGGPDLKKVRELDGKGKVRELGRWMLDKGMGKAGTSLDDIAEQSGKIRAEAGSKLDDVYKEAQDKFGEKITGIGFDPKRDKELVLKAAREELGDSVGAEAALKKLSNYLDEVAGRHGDLPNEQALAKYQDEVAEYLPKFRQHIKETVQFKRAVGKAGENADQPILQGMGDDLQRTGQANRQIEVNGKPATNMREELPEYATQQDLMELPQQQQMNLFNSPRGEDLTPLAQKIAMDQRSKQLIASESQQAAIEGLESVPRSMREVSENVIAGNKGQTNMVFQPGQAPVRPSRPAEVRNPMAPRRANDIKGAIDDEINYSRNPLTKEPASEKAFVAARRAVAQKVDDAIESLGGDELLQSLKTANKEYGAAATINKMANDRLSRNKANNILGLTDAITGTAGLAYAGATGDWQTGLGVFAGKKALQKYGVAGAAGLLDKVSKKLMQNPKAAQLAKSDPQLYKEVVARLSGRIGGVYQPSASFPRAADQNDDVMKVQPLKGEDKWANDGLKNLEKATGEKFDRGAMLQDKKTRKLLMEASGLTPGSKAMNAVIAKLKAANNG